MFFALGSSIGYRRGVKDALARTRSLRSIASGCRSLPIHHRRRRDSSRVRPRSGERRARWGVAALRPAGAAQATGRTIVGGRRSAVVAAAIALAVVMLVGVPVTSVGATTAQPGERLWRVKLSLEQVRLVVASATGDGAEVHVDLAATRLGELHGLVGDDVAPAVVDEVTTALADHAEAAGDQLEDMTDREQRVELVRRLTAVVDEQATVLTTMVAVDCAADETGDCAALRRVRDGSVELRDETVGIAVATPVPGDTSTPVVVQDDLADRLGSSAGDGAAGDAPAAAAGGGSGDAQDPADTGANSGQGGTSGDGGSQAAPASGSGDGTTQQSGGQTASGSGGGDASSSGGTSTAAKPAPAPPAEAPAPAPAPDPAPSASERRSGEQQPSPTPSTDTQGDQASAATTTDGP